MQPEFKPGDIVTYMPYEAAHRRKVVSIQHGALGDNKCVSGEIDNRIFYKLAVVGLKPIVVCTITTGLCIMESELFEPHKEDY